MKMDICHKSNSLHLNIFYLLTVVLIFVTYKFWPPDRKIHSDYRLQDYYDNAIKKLKDKRYLPWKQFDGTEISKVKDKNLRYILVWTSSMNKPFNKMGNGEVVFADKFCPYFNCFVTDDVNYFKAETEFDAILFGAEVVRLTNNLLPEQRLPYQKYVFVSMGSAQENTVCTEKFDSYFNWTWTYRLDSEIKSGLVVRDLNETIVAPKHEVHWIPTQRKYTLPHDLSDIIENKTKAAAWIVSDCNTYSYREKIALSLREELKRHLLTLDIYGKCGEFRCESETSCDKTIERDYYFYLAFEDSLCKDYVTTELLHALRYNAVPIVYGGANYTRYVVIFLLFLFFSRYYPTAWQRTALTFSIQRDLTPLQAYLIYISNTSRHILLDLSRLRLAFAGIDSVVIFGHS